MSTKVQFTHFMWTSGIRQVLLLLFFLPTTDTSCHCVIKQLMPEGCDAGCGTSQQDTHDYNVGWVPASSSLNATWPYSRASTLNGISFPGQFGTYPGSGYVVNMPVKSMERVEIIGIENIVHSPVLDLCYSK